MPDAAQVFQAVFECPVGWLGMRTQAGALVELGLFRERPPTAGSADAVTRQTAAALQRYFQTGMPGELPPLDLHGTEFQRRVWVELLRIPPGVTFTYGQLAARLDTHPRAIGGACRANPVIILVPCHRVVASGGDGGYAGHRAGPWLDTKRWLIAHERETPP